MSLCTLLTYLIERDAVDGRGVAPELADDTVATDVPEEEGLVGADRHEPAVVRRHRHILNLNASSSWTPRAGSERAHFQVSQKSSLADVFRRGFQPSKWLFAVFNSEGSRASEAGLTSYPCGPVYVCTRKPFDMSSASERNGFQSLTVRSWPAVTQYEPFSGWIARAADPGLSFMSSGGLLQSGTHH